MIGKNFDVDASWVVWKLKKFRRTSSKSVSQRQKIYSNERTPTQLPVNDGESVKNVVKTHNELPVNFTLKRIQKLRCSASIPVNSVESVWCSLVGWWWKRKMKLKINQPTFSSSYHKPIARRPSNVLALLVLNGITFLTRQFPSAKFVIFARVSNYTKRAAAEKSLSIFTSLTFDFSVNNISLSEMLDSIVEFRNDHVTFFWIMKKWHLWSRKKIPRRWQLFFTSFFHTLQLLTSSFREDIAMCRVDWMWKTQQTLAWANKKCFSLLFYVLRTDNVVIIYIASHLTSSTGKNWNTCRKRNETFFGNKISLKLMMRVWNNKQIRQTFFKVLVVSILVEIANCQSSSAETFSLYNLKTFLIFHWNKSGNKGAKKIFTKWHIKVKQ